MKFDISCLQPKEQASFALRALYEAAGCRKYHMGRFEEYGLYQENRSFLSSEQVITFTDLDGRLLALKPDVTLSIAKTAQPAPGETLRYYYHENVYRPSAESHTFQEIGQMGLELLGEVGETQVRQAVSLAAQSLAQLGKPWVLEVSHMGYLFGLLDALDVPEASRAALLAKLKAKNLHELKAAASAAGLDEADADALAGLMSLCGSCEDVLPRVEAACRNERMEAAAAELKAITEELTGAGGSIRLDMTLAGEMEYYNGLVFQGYLKALPRPLLKGGRYDLLMQKFTPRAGAIGFAVYLDELDRLSLNAMNSLMTRRDVIVVASVSCIYGLSTPEDYRNLTLRIREGDIMDRDVFLRQLVERLFERQDFDFLRGTFRVRGDTVEIYPVYWSGRAIRVEFFGDEIDRISEINAVSGMPERVISHVAIYPASHYVASRDKLNRAILEIEREMEERERWFKEHDKLLEAQRIRQRTMYDIEMLQEIGFCSGIENYSRVISGRAPGTPPMTLLDYFPKDFLLFVDESHVTLPQVRAMYAGDRSRKESLVEYGFRLPSAFDNRPLTFPEFEEKVHQAIYVSATPGEYERSRAGQIAEQVIRPTGLLDPKVEVRPIDGQVDDLIGECNRIIERKERVLVTTLTKKMAEDLTTYLQNAGIRVRYMHSDVAALERMEILRDLRMAKFDVLVGINLLREGLDLPEVSLVAILDADKEGFLRSETSLIQTIGRAARNAEGRVIMYADTVTPSMRAAIDETARRRAKQDAYNKAHGIVPKTIVKDVRELIEITQAEGEAQRRDGVKMTAAEREREIAKLEKEMRAAAKQMEYEYAAVLRDRIIELRGKKD